MKQQIYVSLPFSLKSNKENIFLKELLVSILKVDFRKYKGKQTLYLIKHRNLVEEKKITSTLTPTKWLTKLHKIKSNQECKWILHSGKFSFALGMQG